MKCPRCKEDNDRVVDSREVHAGRVIWRRRACTGCNRRYTSYERIEDVVVQLIKKDGRRERFDRQKLLAGMRTACEKRPVSTAQLEQIVDRVERQCMEAFDKEVPSKVIGELVIQELPQLDQVGITFERHPHGRIEGQLQPSHKTWYGGDVVRLDGLIVRGRHDLATSRRVRSTDLLVPSCIRHCQ